MGKLILVRTEGRRKQMHILEYFSSQTPHPPKTKLRQNSSRVESNTSSVEFLDQSTSNQSSLAQSGNRVEYSKSGPL